MSENMNEKKHIGLMLIALAAIVGAGALFLTNNSANDASQNNGTKTPEVTSTDTTYEELTFPGNTLDTSDWETYRNEEFWFEVKYPRGWGVIAKTKKQLLEENPGYIEYGSSYKGQVVFDPHGDPYSFVTLDVYFEPVDQMTEKRKWASFADPGPPLPKIGEINDIKVSYYTTSDPGELDQSPFLVFLGNTSISYEIHNKLSGFLGVFEQILLSFKLLK